MSSPIAALRQWVETVTGLTVIYGDDPEPTAPRPNVDPAVSTYAEIGLEPHSSTYSTPYSAIRGPEDSKPTTRYTSQIRSGLLAVEIFGPGAEDYASALEMSRDHQSTIDLLKVSGDISLGAFGARDEDSVLRSTEREPDVSFTVEVQWSESIEAETDEVVESVEITAQVDDLEIVKETDA